MKSMFRGLELFLAVALLGTSLVAQTNGAARFDSAIQAAATQKLQSKAQFRGVLATVEDGIITLSGNVDLYQQKLDAAKRVKKVAKAQGVRNLIVVAGKAVPDAQLESQLDRKLYYDRMGYDIGFSFVTASVDDGVATLDGAARTDYDRDSAFSLASMMPGVKDVVDNVKVLPASPFDDRIRIATARAIYRDPVLSRYAIDPARPIRIVVDGGHVALYGVVANQSDKNIAGIRANQVFGVFSVQNNLEVAKKS